MDSPVPLSPLHYTSHCIFMSRVKSTPVQPPRHQQQDPDADLRKVIEALTKRWVAEGNTESDIIFSKFGKFLHLDEDTTPTTKSEPLSRSYVPLAPPTSSSRPACPSHSSPSRKPLLKRSPPSVRLEQEYHANALPFCVRKNTIDIEAQLAIQNKFKTELCKFQVENGECPFGDKCHFAHSTEELLPVLRHPNYKTKECQNFFLHGTCAYGVRCRFIHRKRGNSDGITKSESNTTNSQEGQESTDHNAVDETLDCAGWSLML